jgi:pimeloyl-ACP methyl ester carboxylesterase
MTENLRIPTDDFAYLSAIFLPPQERTAKNTEDKLVVMVHGYPSGSKLGADHIFDDLEAVITQDGYATLRFDFRNCGESDTTENGFSLKNAVADIQNVFAWAKERERPRIILIAEGLGAALALSLQSPQVECAILLWAILDPKSVEWKEVEISGTLKEEIEAFNTVPALENLSVPTLIQHGTADDRAPIAQLDLLRKHVQRNRRIEITSYENGKHGLGRFNERQMVFFHIRQFLQKYG